MDRVLTEFRLEDLSHHHRIDAGVFIPFVIARMWDDTAPSEISLTIVLRNFDGIAEQTQNLKITWSDDAANRVALTVADRTLTEWAACGVACVVLACYTNLRIHQVTLSGDRFDYWVSDGKREYGLEISGTMTDDIEARHRVKVRQLCENPYGVDGIVIVSGFASRKVICSLHSFEEAV